LSRDVFTLAENPFNEMSVTIESATHSTNTSACRRERTIWRTIKWMFNRPLVMGVLSTSLM